jgi:hypothetical protein
MKVCRFVIENSGGEGRFVILPKSSWPTTNFKVNFSDLAFLMIIQTRFNIHFRQIYLQQILI